MTVFWLGGLLALLVMAVLLIPFWRREQAGRLPGREARIYQDQLAEVDRDKDRGVLSDAEATAARHEIERRLLGAARREAAGGAGVSRAGRFFVLFLVALVPVLGGAVYFYLGSPERPGASFAARQQAAAAAGEERAQMAELVVELAEKLAARPDDLEGHILLARSYESLGEYDKALAAYGTANRLAGGRDPDLAGKYAELMVVTNDGQVPAAAVRLFTLLKRDFPNDPQASYYLALAKAQRGDREGALADLEALLQTAPPSAPWRPNVEALRESLRDGPAE